MVDASFAIFARPRAPSQSKCVRAPEDRPMSYGFTMQVAGIDAKSDDYEDALYNAGCGDALIIVLDGTILLDFQREDVTFEKAVESASRNVEKAGGRVVKVSPLPD
jgi:hypothetical protein